MVNTVVVRPTIQQTFERFLQQERVLFFSAPCGFGKTTVARELAGEKGVLYLTAETPDFSVPAEDGTWQILVVDDAQQMTEEECQTLCRLIRTCPGRRFMILSRGAVPGCMMAFQYAGIMTVLEAEALLFDREDIRRLFQGEGIALTEGIVSGILKESIGYPLGVAVTARCMAGGQPFEQKLVSRAFREVFRYFETAVYQRFELPLRRFLPELAPFDSFDLEMARMVSGNPRAGELLDWLQRSTTMLRYDGIERFHFWPQFRAFLQWEMEREYTPEQQKACFKRGGLYYELREEYVQALDCYTRGGDHAKVSELLGRTAELHPGMGHYSQMEKYYSSLPEGEVLSSPALMQGMSMLCALKMDYQGSERWYEALEQFAQRCSKGDAAGRQARSCLAWLDISLPQRGVERLTDTIPAVFRLITGREVRLPAFSVTSALPSIMNGGKDFSPWSRQDDMLYRTMRIPLETVLGRDGVGLADCAIAESKFEKGEDISGRMLRLVCADKSNAEIGELMDIKVTTVKTHVSHILDKLGVSRRSEAKTAARRLWLVPDER